MQENNKIKLGAFLLISIVLLVTSFTAAGIGKLMKPKLKAMTLLNTSVEGMTIGSPVKYLGMTIGKITGLAMRGRSSQIIVYFDLFPDMVMDDFDEGSDGKFDRGDLEKLANSHQLHCFINAAGLMGGSYLELEFSNDRDNSENRPAVRPPDGITYIPSKPSHIGNAIQNVSRLLEDVKEINLPRAADRIDKLLDNLDRGLNNGELDRTMMALNRTCGNLEQLSERLITVLNDENMDKFHKMIVNFELASTRLEEFSGKADLAEVCRNAGVFFREAMQLLQNVGSGTGRVGTELTIFRRRLEHSLIRLDNVMQAISNTLSSLEDDPSQFIRGKNPAAR